MCFAGRSRVTGTTYQNPPSISGGMAQLAAHLTCNQAVVSSTLTTTSIYNNILA